MVGWYGDGTGVLVFDRSACGYLGRPRSLLAGHFDPLDSRMSRYLPSAIARSHSAYAQHYEIQELDITLIELKE